MSETLEEIANSTKVVRVYSGDYEKLLVLQTALNMKTGKAHSLADCVKELLRIAEATQK